MQNTGHSMLKGAASGVAATAVMTLFIEAAKKRGHLRVEPPKLITANVERKADVEVVPGADFQTRWLTAHTAFGAGAGAAFAAMRGALPRNPLVAGVLFGAGVWAAMYPAVLPLAGLYPKPKDDSEGRAWTIGLAHLVYGAALGVTYGRNRNS